jgi:rhodanese-related sulfurtransferase/transcriptional regulator with XRE-family HTH domain
MVQTLGPREAAALVAKGGVPIIDVREPEEFATGHIPNARNVPLDELRSNWGKGDAQIADNVLFVCQRGARSLAASEFAEAHGLKQIYSLEGGTSAWSAAGLPIDRAPSVPGPPSSRRIRLHESGEHVAEGEVDPELDAVVGSNVSALRAQRGITLDTLAGLSGVGRQTLGQIELGRTVPSLGTLWKIARAFDVPFSVLIARPESTATRVLKSAGAKRLVSVDGRFSSRALFPPGEKGRAEFYELWLAGYGRDDAEAHASGTRENLVVTEGRLVMEIGKDRYELSKGDAIVFIADVPHAYINPSSDECWMNLVMTYSIA